MSTNFRSRDSALHPLPTCLTTTLLLDLKFLWTSDLFPRTSPPSRGAVLRPRDPATLLLLHWTPPHPIVLLPSAHGFLLVRPKQPISHCPTLLHPTSDLSPRSYGSIPRTHRSYGHYYCVDLCRGRQDCGSLDQVHHSSLSGSPRTSPSTLFPRQNGVG